MVDISAFETTEPAGDITGLVEKAKELVDLETRAKMLEESLELINKRANELKTKVIPERMAELGLTNFTTADGAHLRVEDFISGGLPKDPLKKARAIAELEAMGAGSIIRNEINLAFDKAQHNEAIALAHDLRDRGFNAEVTSGVHPSTYKALVRERLRNGEPIDTEALGVYVGRHTKVELPK